MTFQTRTKIKCRQRSEIFVFNSYLEFFFHWDLGYFISQETKKNTHTHTSTKNTSCLIRKKNSGATYLHVFLLYLANDDDDYIKTSKTREYVNNLCDHILK